MQIPVEPMISTGPVAIPESEVWRLDSATGDEYRIFVARPMGAQPEGGYPVIFVLDANATFGTVTEAIRLRARRPDVTGVVPTLVVGIAYPTTGPFDRTRRTFDFTAGPAAEPELAAQAGDTGARTGGADAFRALIMDLVPRVAAAFPIDPSRLTLFGHSLGGYFVLRTLLESPGAFQSYVAASPSVWWERQGLLDRIDALRPRLHATGSPTRVLLTVGEYEEKLAPGEIEHEGAVRIAERRGSRAMVSHARTLAERLLSLNDARLTVRFEEFPGEDHASSLLRTINVFPRFVLAGRGGT